MKKPGWMVLAVAVVAAALGPFAAAEEVTVWQTPASADPGARQGWKAAGAGSAFPTGAALDNGRVMLLAAPGAEGMILASSQHPATAVEIRAVSAAGASAKIESVRLVQQDEGEAVLDAALAGGAQVRVKLAAGALHVEVAGLKDLDAVDVCGRIKNTVLPDLFGFDAIFAPERYQSDKLTVPAENFLLNFLEGGDGIAMCVWQGTLTLGAEDAKAGREPKVELFLSGEGAARRIDKSRIEFAGKPVFIALLAAKGIWHEEDVSDWEAQKPTELAWKPPFEAKWRASFVAKEGMASADLVSPYLSNDVFYRDHVAKWVGDVPTISLQGLWPYFIYSFWIHQDEAHLALYADMNDRKGVERANRDEKTAAKKEGREAKTFYPKNVYAKALIYPLDRRTNTPLTESTPVDVMRSCLGQGPCEYVLDLEGVKGRPSGGSRNTLATCGNWDNNIRHFVDAAKGRSPNFRIEDRKLVGLKAGEKFPPEFEERLVINLEDMALFVTAVNKRLLEYQEFSARLIAYCKDQAGKSDAVKPAAASILKLAQGLQASVSDRTMADFNRQRDEWDKRVQEMIADVKAGKYDTFDKVGAIRSYAERQDITVSACRRFAKSIRIEASTTDSSDPAVLKFTSDVRSMCHQIMRNKHGMEGF